MRRLEIATAAERDLDDIQQYLDDITGDDRVADRVLDRLLAQCDRLAALPGTLGRARPEIRQGLRSFPFGNYVIYFHYPDEETLKVVNVLSAKQDSDDFPFDVDDLLE